MKIGIWHNLPSGGGKRALYDQIRGLQDLGHTIFIWTMESNEDRFLDLSKLCVTRKFSYSKIYKGIHYTYKSPFLIWNLQKEYNHIFSMVQKEATGLGVEAFLIHPESIFRVPLIGSNLLIPSLIYLHEPYRWLYEALPRLPYELSLRRLGDINRLLGCVYHHRLEKKSLKNYKRILVNSLFSRESVMRAYGFESYVNYLGIDGDRLKNPYNELERLNVCVGLGTVYHAKGIDRAIKIISLIPKNFRPKIEWIGNGAWQSDLDSYNVLAKELGVEIEFFLNASNEKVLELVGRSKFMIYTSRLEPFGYAPLESMALGTPVAALPEGGVRETVIDGFNGLLSIDGGFESLAMKITEAYENDSFKALGEKAHESVFKKWKISESVQVLQKHLAEISKR